MISVSVNQKQSSIVKVSFHDIDCDTQVNVYQYVHRWMCINMYKTNLVKLKIEELERRIFFKSENWGKI